MSIVGEGFDGLWYAEPFEDYFIKRWGPDGQDEGKASTGASPSTTSSPASAAASTSSTAATRWCGSTTHSAAGHGWGSIPADYSGGAQALTATAELNVPLELDVVAWDGFNEGSPPASPQRTGSDPFEGAEVAPVSTNAKGFELIETESADTVVTDENGEASISFDEPGWHRIKATSIDPAG